MVIILLINFTLHTFFFCGVVNLYVMKHLPLIYDRHLFHIIFVKTSVKNIYVKGRCKLKVRCTWNI